MGLMGMIGVTGMLMSVANSGKKSVFQTEKLKQTILDMNAKIKKFTNGYTELLTVGATDIQRIIAEMNMDVQLITQLSRQMESEKNDHALLYRSIQMAGIILVSTIGLIFILKLFDFYDIIQNFIEYPFLSLFRKK